jgi:hypothetical protein
MHFPTLTKLEDQKLVNGYSSEKIYKKRSEMKINLPVTQREVELKDSTTIVSKIDISFAFL